MKNINKEQVIAMSISGCVGGLIVAAVSAITVEKKMRDKVHDYFYKERLFVRESMDKLESTVEKADAKIKNFDDEVDKAVRFVYDTEARNAFDKRLKSVNVEALAEGICKTEIHKVEDSVIRREIKSQYDKQIKTVMESELKEYFKEGIKKYIDVDIDSDFIRRTAKQYIRDIVDEAVETEAEKAVDACDVEKLIEKELDLDDFVEDYFDSNQKKILASIERSARDILEDKFSEDVIDDIVEAIKDEYRK